MVAESLRRHSHGKQPHEKRAQRCRLDRFMQDRQSRRRRAQSHGVRTIGSDEHRGEIRAELAAQAIYTMDAVTFLVQMIIDYKYVRALGFARKQLHRLDRA